MRCTLVALAVCAITAAAAENGVKYHPGHYVALEGGAKLESFAYLDEPAIKGFNIRYTWATLEPKENQYDFSAIHKDLTVLARHRKQLAAFLTDKTFYNGPTPLPAYMSGYELTSETRGITPKRWDPRLTDREIALSRALAREFDADPNFEGIAWQESALSIPRQQMQAVGYTPELYRDALIRLLTESSRAFAHSEVFWYQNFLPGKNEYCYDIAKAVLAYHVVLGGPDILPYRTGLQSNYKIYDELQGKMRLSCSAQADSYCHHKDDTVNGRKGPFHEGKKPINPEGYVPMEKIFEFGRDRLHLNYIFWSYVTRRPKQYPGDPLAFVFDDALKVIRANPAFN